MSKHIKWRAAIWVLPLLVLPILRASEIEENSSHKGNIPHFILLEGKKKSSLYTEVKDQLWGDIKYCIFPKFSLNEITKSLVLAAITQMGNLVLEDKDEKLSLKSFLYALSVRTILIYIGVLVKNFYRRGTIPRYFNSEEILFKVLSLFYFNLSTAYIISSKWLIAFVITFLGGLSIEVIQLPIWRKKKYSNLSKLIVRSIMLPLSFAWAVLFVLLAKSKNSSVQGLIKDAGFLLDDTTNEFLDQLSQYNTVMIMWLFSHLSDKIYIGQVSNEEGGAAGGDGGGDAGGKKKTPPVSIKVFLQKMIDEVPELSDLIKKITSYLGGQDAPLHKGIKNTLIEIFSELMKDILL